VVVYVLSNGLNEQLHRVIILVAEYPEATKLPRSNHSPTAQGIIHQHIVIQRM
jgi:hypothetical protein